MQSARLRDSQATERIRESVAAGRISAIRSERHSSIRTWSIVIQREHLVVERHGVRTGCSQICECRGLKLRAWDVRIYAGWQHDTQTFVVHEEKRLVFFDGTAKGRSPLVGVVKRPWCPALVVEVIVCIHRPAVPPVDRITVKRVRSSLRDIVNVCACQASVLAGISVIDDRSFIHVVLTEKKISRTRVVQVQERIVFIHAVHGEQIGSGGKAISCAAAVTRLRIHHCAWRGLHNVAEIVPGVRNERNLIRAEGCGQIRIFRLNGAAFARDFHDLLSCAESKLETERTGLSDAYCSLALCRLKVLRARRNRVGARRKQRKSVRALSIRILRLRRSGLGILCRDGRVRDHRPGWIRYNACDVSGG